MDCACRPVRQNIVMMTAPGIGNVRVLNKVGLSFAEETARVNGDAVAGSRQARRPTLNCVCGYLFEARAVDSRDLLRRTTFNFQPSCSRCRRQWHASRE